MSSNGNTTINTAGKTANVVGGPQHINNQTNNYWGGGTNTRQNIDKPTIFDVPSTLTDDEYIGHEELLKTVSAAVKENKKVALYGLGGIGKSRLAAEVAHMLHPETFDNVFWINAVNVTSFMRGMECIADTLDLHIKPDASSVANSVKIWLENKKNGSWLLVLDGASLEAVSESAEVSVDSKEKNFVKRLPQRSASPLRTILVTTCEKMVAQRWCQDTAVFEVPFLEPEKAESLLAIASGNQRSDPEDVAKLAKELDCNPTVILSAAAYIRTHSEAGATISTYLQTFPKVRDRDRSIEMLDGTTTATIRKNIDALHHKSTKASDLLSLIACLDGAKISCDLFRHAFGWSQEALQDPLADLLSYRLISPLGGSREDFSMPRLVRWAVRRWLKTQPRPQSPETPSVLLTWHLKAMDSLLVAYDGMHPKSGQSVIKAQLQRRALLPHVDRFQQFCRRQRHNTIALQEGQFRAIVVFAELFLSEGRYKSAENMLGFARESPVEQSHWRKIGMLRLAESLRNQSLVDGAPERLQKAMGIVKEVHKIATDEQNVDLCSTLALLYTDGGDFKKAAYYQSRIVRELTKDIGIDSLQTLDARLDLSKIRWREGNLTYALAEQLKIKLILLDEDRTADPDNTSRLLQVDAALVRTYHSLGYFRKATKIAASVAVGRSQLFGELDMKTIGSEKDLGHCLGAINQESEAIRVFEEVERKLRQKFGLDHQEVGGCFSRLNGIRNEVPPLDGMALSIGGGKQVI